jgi:hypothetical protein
MMDVTMTGVQFRRTISRVRGSKPLSSNKHEPNSMSLVPLSHDHIPCMYVYSNIDVPKCSNSPYITTLGPPESSASASRLRHTGHRNKFEYDIGMS